MKKTVFHFLSFMVIITISQINAQQEINIIPNPEHITIGKGFYRLGSQIKISFPPEADNEVTLLQGFIQNGMNSAVQMIESENSKEANIVFAYDEKLEREGYRLVVSEGGIKITASNNSGWFYGVQSLRQLFPADYEFIKVRHSHVDIPEVEIVDAPRFSWRAFMLDEARHFKGKEQVKLLLDEMARLKMNVFHWHLVDDQGWRIEIKKYPLLTEIGSKRKSTQVGPLKSRSPIQTGIPHEGYYTQTDIKEIIEYARKRHIIVVPEIEMPGHSSAAIAAYPWLGATKKKIEVPIRFGVGKDVYDVSDPKVYEFLTNVLDEVMLLFPSKVVHIGGDEVRYNYWKISNAIAEYMKEKDLRTHAELQLYFTNRISQYLQEKGRRMMGWNEIMGHNIHEYQVELGDNELKQKLAKESIIHFWKGDIDMITQAARKGYDIVNSRSQSTYLDYAYDKIPLSKAYDFDPIPSDLDSKYHDKIIGVGCQMWGEWIPTVGEMYFLIFPRIAAYAEVGWTMLRNKDFNNFKRGLKYLKHQWDHLGIYYAPDSAVENLKQ